MDAALVRLVWRRAGGRCEYCQLSQEFDEERPFEIDHVISRKHEGPTVSGNLALSCFRCNSATRCCASMIRFASSSARS
jgi:5-methylcytosine-specific restriction endonuclease McrA